ncbi:MAG: Pycsar system effector family protein [Bacteroidota bacterium]
MKPSIVDNCRQFITQLFADQLSKDFRYHDLNHTLSVYKYSQQFGQDLKCTEEELELLALAALLHDSGYTRVYEGHEAAGQDIAREWLDQQNYPPAKVETICRLIAATIPNKKPRNKLQEIIKDADLSNVGSDHFFESGEKLRHEWSTLLEQHYDDLEWRVNTLVFLNNHRYYTAPAKSLFGAQKKSNLKKLKKLIKKEKKELVKKEGTDIANSRSAQMMFKTALRNHIDLTNIADNKANMMLSINTIVITITMPLLAGNIEDNMFLVFPASILLITCVLSVIFATMATRPIKMTGLSDPSKINKGQTNYFFFGNFYRMSNPDYQSGIRQVISNEEALETTIINDLFYLGRALGQKYNQLRICYGIFMIGITLTVISFAISFFLAVGSAS